MRKLKGVITSNKMNKTVAVRVDRLKKHTKYLKYYRVTNVFKAHDEQNEYKTGDTVIIQETRPLSRVKRWRVVQLVKRQGAESESEETQDNVEKKPEA